MIDLQTCCTTRQAVPTRFVPFSCNKFTSITTFSMHIYYHSRDTELILRTLEYKLLNKPLSYFSTHFSMHCWQPGNICNQHDSIQPVMISEDAKLIFLHDKACGHRK